MSYKVKTVPGANGKGFALAPDFPVKDDAVPVEPPKAEKAEEGLLYSKHIKSPEPNGTPVKHSNCYPPRFGNNTVYQSAEEHRRDIERIPDGSFWTCNVCHAVYQARSKNKYWFDNEGKRKRRWAKMHWYSFVMSDEWDLVKDKYYPGRYEPAR